MQLHSFWYLQNFLKEKSIFAICLSVYLFNRTQVNTSDHVSLQLCCHSLLYTVLPFDCLFLTSLLTFNVSCKWQILQILLLDHLYQKLPISDSIYECSVRFHFPSNIFGLIKAFPASFCVTRSLLLEISPSSVSKLCISSIGIK